MEPPVSKSFCHVTEAAATADGLMVKCDPIPNAIGLMDIVYAKCLRPGKPSCRRTISTARTLPHPAASAHRRAGIGGNVYTSTGSLPTRITGPTLVPDRRRNRACHCADHDLNFRRVAGELAERLRSGLQIRVHRFESGTHLQPFLTFPNSADSLPIPTPAEASTSYGTGCSHPFRGVPGWDVSEPWSAKYRHLGSIQRQTSIPASRMDRRSM